MFVRRVATAVVLAVGLSLVSPAYAGTAEEVPLTTGGGWSGHVSRTVTWPGYTEQVTYQVDGRHQVDDNVSDYPETGAIWEQPRLTSASLSSSECNGSLDPTPETSVDGYFAVYWYRDTWQLSARSESWYPLSGPDWCGGSTLPMNIGAMESHALDAPIPDTLKGSQTETANGTTTVTEWDLTRQPPPDECMDHLYSTADGSSYLNSAAAPDPDLAWFAMDMRWCLMPGGAVQVKSGMVTQSDLSDNWIFLATLEELGFEPYETDPTVYVTADSVTGRATFGVRTSPVGVVLSLVPTGRLLNKAAEGLTKYKSWRDLGISHDKARDKLDDYVRKHVRQWNDDMDEIVFKALNRVPGVSRNSVLAATVIMSKVFNDIGVAFRHRLVSKLIGGKSMTRRAFKQVFERAEVGLWKVNVTLEAQPDGSATFTNRSKKLIIAETWGHETVS